MTHGSCTLWSVDSLEKNKQTCFGNAASSQSMRTLHARIQRGGRGSGPPPPLKNQKNIGFISNTGPDPLNVTKLASQHSILGHHRSADDGPLLVLFGSSFPVIKNGPPLAKLSENEHALLLFSYLICTKTNKST